METLRFYFKILFSVGVVFALLAIYENYMSYSLKKNGEYMNAAIYKFGTGGKHGHMKLLKYNFIVDGTQYKGNGRWYPNSDTLSVGDSIIIRYNKKRPSHNHLKRDLTSRWWRDEL